MGTARMRLASFAIAVSAAAASVAFTAPPPAAARSATPVVSSRPRALARTARANSLAARTPRHPSAPRAPSGPPLAGAGAAPGTGGGEEAPRSAAVSELDPLVSNGLASPTCDRAALGGLSAVSRQNCETSGFIAAGAPTGDYGIDVHIDTGVLGLSSGGLLSAVQDLFVTPVWLALVWAVHALVVMLEWCFTIDLLAGANLGAVGQGLRRMEGAFTAPWLPLALSIAAVLGAYHGLVRRRVAETAGQTALMAAMMAAGLWLILDPAGTVGALGQWANQAAIGTLATAVQGSPARGEQAFASSLGAVFAAAVDAPWCYLEFGDVEWCRRPSRLDSDLRRAGLRIAALEQSLSGCRSSESALVPCAPAGSAAAKALRRSAQLLRSAQTNGEIFLALPPNGPARNSINDEGSLLQAICHSSDATGCHGASAAQAEFRTNGSTWSRVGGLGLILAGALGMLLLLGFLALRLLAAATFSLLYLLLAPLMVLAPAFGDGGRTAFRGWSTQLLGTVVAKLIYAFLLGVVLAVLAVISGLSAIGWWTQWLLMSALWWGAFIRRHKLLSFGGEVAGGRPSGRHTVRRIGGLRPGRATIGATRWARGKLARERGAPPEQPAVRPTPRRGAAGARGDATPAHEGDRGRQPRRTGADPTGSLTRSGGGGGLGDELELAARLADKRAQLGRISRAREDAVAAGDTRRVGVLARRAERVGEEAEDLERRARGRRSGETHTRESGGVGQRLGDVRRGERSPDSTATTPHPAPERPGERTARQRAGGATRADLDRELAHHRDRLAPRPASEGAPIRPDPSISPRRSGAGDGGRDASNPPAIRGPIRRRPEESSVMRDIREVEAGRKRQLGRDRP
jgi:hypothetical protein